MKKLNLGCGSHTPKNWINIDGSPVLLLNKYIRKKQNICGDGVHYVNILNEFPEKYKNADLIYMSHVIEHFDRLEARVVIKNIYQSLRKTGVLRIITPDLKAKCQQYIERKATASEFLEWTGMIDGGHTSKLRWLMGRSRHRYLYDEVSLKNLLAEFSFDEIRISKFRGSKIGEFNDIDLEKRFDNAICLECVK